MISTPINSLLVEACDQPLHFRREKIGYKYLMKETYTDRSNLNILQNLLIRDCSTEKGLSYKPSTLMNDFGNLMDFSGAMQFWATIQNHIK